MAVGEFEDCPPTNAPVYQLKRKFQTRQVVSLVSQPGRRSLSAVTVGFGVSLSGSVSEFVAGPSGFEPEPQAPQACVLSRLDYGPVH